MKKIKEYKNIFFLCSPNLGALDNWLPVLSCFKDKYKINIIFTKTPNPNIFSSKNQLIKISEKIFDNYLILGFGNNWLKFDSLFEVKSKFSYNKFENFLIYSRVRLNKLKLLSKLLGKLIYLIEKKRFIENIFDVQTITNTGPLFYDIDENYKKYNQPLMKIFNKEKKFSICHGINIHQKNLKYKKILRYKNEVTAYLFSK